MITIRNFDEILAGNVVSGYVDKRSGYLNNNYTRIYKNPTYNEIIDIEDNGIFKFFVDTKKKSLYVHSPQINHDCTMKQLGFKVCDYDLNFIRGSAIIRGNNIRVIEIYFIDSVLRFPIIDLLSDKELYAMFIAFLNLDLSWLRKYNLDMYNYNKQLQLKAIELKNYKNKA